jgi:hypothetical protein
MTGTDHALIAALAFLVAGAFGLIALGFSQIRRLAETLDKHD